MLSAQQWKKITRNYYNYEIVAYHIKVVLINSKSSLKFRLILCLLQNYFLTHLILFSFFLLLMLD